AGTGAQAGWVAPVRGRSGEPVQCLGGSEGSDQAGGVLIPRFGDPAPCGTSHAIVTSIECELLRHGAPCSAGSVQRPLRSCRGGPGPAGPPGSKPPAAHGPRLAW